MYWSFDEDERNLFQLGRRLFCLNASLTQSLQQQFESLPNNQAGGDVGAENNGGFSWK